MMPLFQVTTKLQWQVFPVLGLLRRWLLSWDYAYGIIDNGYGS
jgi:hypothetical protein